MSSATPPNTSPWNFIGPFNTKSVVSSQVILSPNALVEVAITDIGDVPGCINPDPEYMVAL